MVALIRLREACQPESPGVPPFPRRPVGTIGPVAAGFAGSRRSLNAALTVAG
jgi:hypothetical protein